MFAGVGVVVVVVVVVVDVADVVVVPKFFRRGASLVSDHLNVRSLIHCVVPKVFIHADKV